MRVMEDRWFDEELSGCRLGDGRLDSRLRQLVARMDIGFGETIPLACQDWANTKAAYRVEQALVECLGEPVDLSDVRNWAKSRPSYPAEPRPK